ncbi:MAG: beta-propeller fold lactonase family protein [Paludibacter sp.]
MKKNIVVLLVLGMVFSAYAQKTGYRLLIGTYTNTGKSQGIYTYSVDMKTGNFNCQSVTTGISNPSYLAVAPDKKYVYSVNESPEGSAVNAFTFDKKTGKLGLINSALTQSGGPCYISVNSKHVFTANYGGGSISVFGRKKDGSLTDILQLVKHSGKSINTERQTEPHVHQIILSPDKKYLVVNDLGTDNVIVYKYNPESANRDTNSIRYACC